MAISLYNPFEKLYFNQQTCFLTGKNLHSSEEQVNVFPEWILDRYSLHEKKFSMMDQITSFQYKDLKIPCSDAVIKNVLNPFEEEIQQAFTEGYEGVKNLPEERLFQWMAKLVYGVLYHDLMVEQKRAAKREKEFKLSALLEKRFRLLHLMMQSLVVPMEFHGVKPWSIRVVKIKYSKDVFNYKDEPTKLNFSLGMNGFGIVACLQDNGAVGNSQQGIFDKISTKTLHPVQFEELCSRFIYANYLLKYDPEYDVQVKGDKVIITSVPLAETAFNPLFARWDDDMFAQVLADYWKPWGMTKKEIYTFPDSPVSFLENDYTHEIIEPESITLPF